MNLNEQLKKFFKDNEWNINKLKGGDVYYYIEENFKPNVDGEAEYLHKLGFQSGFGEGVVSQQTEIEKLQKHIENLQAELESLQGMYNEVSLTAGEWNNVPNGATHYSDTDNDIVFYQVTNNILYWDSDYGIWDEVYFELPELKKK